MLVGNADYFQKVAKVGEAPQKENYFYDCFVKKYDAKTTLMGSNRAHYEEPIRKCFSNPTFVHNQLVPLRLLTEKFAEQLINQADSYTKVISQLKPS